MRVWIVNHYAMPPGMGGLVRHYYFSRYLQKQGHSVRIITSGRVHNTDINMTQKGALYTVDTVENVEYTFVKSSEYSGNGLSRIMNLISFPFYIWKTMKEFYKTERPDVIYASSPDLFVVLFAVVFGKIKKIPVVLEVRDLWPESIVEYNGTSKNNPIIRVLYMLEKWIYKKSDRLIFTMAGGREYIADKKWNKAIDVEKIRHVNNGVDLKQFDENVKLYKVDDKELEDETKFKVVYVGSIRKANNVETLVNVAKILQEQKEDEISIIIYGDGNEREYLEQKCKEANLTNIFFKGRVGNKYIPYILSKSNLNILNYKQANTWKYGGSQNKQFEYLASGTPICSNVKMGYSIIDKYMCGIEENITSTERYVEIIKSYKEMPKEQYEAQCERARLASTNYEYDVLGSKIESILKEVCR